MKRNRQNNENKEKRAHPRKTLVTRVTYEVIIHSKGETLTQNISEGGLCLILDRELSPGTALELKIDLPGKEAKTIQISAEIVWQKKTEMGILSGLKLK